MSLLGSMFAGAIGGGGQVAHDVGKRVQEKNIREEEASIADKRLQARDKMRMAFQSSERVAGETAASTESALDRAQRLKIAQMKPASTGMPEHITVQIAGVDLQLTGYQEKIGNGLALTKDEQTHMDKLISQRSMLAGGYIPPNPDAGGGGGGGDPGADPGAGGGSADPGAKPRVETPADPGLLDMAARPPSAMDYANSGEISSPEQAKQIADRIIQQNGLGDSFTGNDLRQKQFLQSNAPKVLDVLIRQPNPVLTR